MLAIGVDRYAIAREAGVTPGQVSAIAAHVSMGTYNLPVTTDEPLQESASADFDAPRSHIAPQETTSNILDKLQRTDGPPQERTGAIPVYLGEDTEAKTDVFWNPDPESGAANPHMLVLGESGFGKTYTISAILAELARKKISSIVFDYGQGFSGGAAPKEFLGHVKPVEIDVGREGININPLQIFPSDLHGPVNVAQRIADTFSRVYSRIGVQQHAVLRQAVLEVMTEAGILPDSPSSWSRALPAFGSVQQRLEFYAAHPTDPRSRVAASVASHISTIFVFNTFRSAGHGMHWPQMLTSEGGVFVLQLKGLEHSLEQVVTEFLLWNLIGLVEALGPSSLRCFVVLDEAHRLSFDRGSPVEKLLREGRKFGLGLILASQEATDFSSSAFANTATKVVFQIPDENNHVSRQLHRKARNFRSSPAISEVVTKLPRGCAFTVSGNVGTVVRIASFAERDKRWLAKEW